MIALISLLGGALTTGVVLIIGAYDKRRSSKHTAVDVAAPWSIWGDLLPEDREWVTWHYKTLAGGEPPALLSACAEAKPIEAAAPAIIKPPPYDFTVRSGDGSLAVRYAVPARATRIDGDGWAVQVGDTQRPLTWDGVHPSNAGHMPPQAA